MSINFINMFSQLSVMNYRKQQYNDVDENTVEFSNTTMIGLYDVIIKYGST